jgi:hypothetical protein
VVGVVVVGIVVVVVGVEVVVVGVVVLSVVIRVCTIKIQRYKAASTIIEFCCICLYIEMQYKMCSMTYLVRILF